MERTMVPHDGNSAVAHVAHAVNEVIAIYPITPSSPMGEIADVKSARGEKNIWGSTPDVVELQSEGGASGAVHGALSAGALTTTFTASQGLLLMIPNMYKIAGELLPTVFHIASRSLACQALSIFGDHSDVMAARATGWGFLASGSVQEAMDMALIAHAATLQTSLPFLHFFEGFRVSHEIQKVEQLTYEDMKHMIDEEKVREYRERGMNPEHPVLRGTSQNPDVYFQGRESVNRYYEECPAKVQGAMDRFAELTGRSYHLFDYVGAEDAERVIILMGAGAEAVHETVEYLNGEGEKVGVLKVRLFRPFDTSAFVSALPDTVKSIAVLDRTKEPGSLGEPLYEDVRTAIGEAMSEGLVDYSGYPKVVGGRYGLGSKEFTPAMIKGVYDNLKKDKPKNHFTVGIEDDVTDTSIEFDPSFSTESDEIYRAMFYGLGSDGTVGANKNSIKIIAQETENNAQGYFVYDSKKAGAVTISHLRFGKKPIRSSYLISKANFLACHNFSFLEKYDMLKNLEDGGIFLLTSSHSKDTVWDHLPAGVQKQIIDKDLKFYVIDAVKIAEEVGLGGRINVIMQTAFFKISGVIEEKLALDSIKKAIKKTYGKKGEKVVEMNVKAVDMAVDRIEEVDVPEKVTAETGENKVVPEEAPDFVKQTTSKLIKGEGDTVKVSEMPADGTWPTATTQYEKRNIAVNIPVWNPDTCIQCGKCTMVCPHAVIRAKLCSEEDLKGAPENFKYTGVKPKPKEGYVYTLQVSPEDCTGCGACVENCPMKAKQAISMQPQEPLREQEAENFRFFLGLPETDPSLYTRAAMNGIQFVRPLFEFSGACAGCGETAYVKLLSQLFGDRALIANATGCSSIYGGNLPTTPYTRRLDGRGPAWNNSLFEDNAEIAYGMRLTVDKYSEYARELADRVIEKGSCDSELISLLKEMKEAEQDSQDQIEAQRKRSDKVRELLDKCDCEDCRELSSVVDYFIKRSVWGLGGDGWAYDIGYGGLDHVLASGRNVNVLVLDTEVYSNTGGQASKATPMGAVAKFAASGKPIGKKDLGLMALSYGYIYVAKVALGANPMQVVKAMIEAEQYDGPSLVIAYAHCIAHGINMTKGYQEHKKAVDSGHWPLYRYNPDLCEEGKNPLTLDSKEPSISLEEYVSGENRYNMLRRSDPERADLLLNKAQKLVEDHFALYKYLADRKTASCEEEPREVKSS
jgi:pyruvate-ferredoxin/flavodoxin oxidoreductase